VALPLPVGRRRLSNAGRPAHTAGAARGGVLGGRRLFADAGHCLRVRLAEGSVSMAVGVPENIFLARLDALANWVRKNSLWPMPFATACCGIELMATGASRHDIARFGAEAMRFSPRQCDVMIVSGRVVMKILPGLQRTRYEGPRPLALPIDPKDAMVAPGDFASATRLR